MGVHWSWFCAKFSFVEQIPLQPPLLKNIDCFAGKKENTSSFNDSIPYPPISSCRIILIDWNFNVRTDHRLLKKIRLPWIQIMACLPVLMFIVDGIDLKLIKKNKLPWRLTKEEVKLSTLICKIKINITKSVCSAKSYTPIIVISLEHCRTSLNVKEIDKKKIIRKIVRFSTPCEKHH